MKKILAIFLAALMLASMSLVIGSAADELIDRTAGEDLDGDAFMIKGDDIHAYPEKSSKPVYPVYINKLNKAGSNGDTVILTGDVIDMIGKTESDFKGFAGIVAEYDRTTYRYVIKEVLEEDADKTDVEIPEDGFALLVSEWDSSADGADAVPEDWRTKSATNATNLEEYAKGDNVAVEGVAVAEVKFDFYRTSEAPTLDGIIGAGEYGEPVMEINGNSKYCDYRHFELNDQYATGRFYATYDDDYIYLGWDITSEYHHYPATTNDADMWSVDCVQINIMTINPNAVENYDNFDGWGNNHAKETFIYQIGVGVNENGETRTVNWMNSPGEWEGKATRDDDAGRTIYEAKLPKDSFAQEGYELDLTDGNIIGVSFTINTFDTKQRVVRLRDGGGIFGSNDWTKTPIVTLKGTYGEPSDESEDSKDDTTTPATGDSTMAIIAIAVMAMFGAAVVVKKAR